MTTIAEWLREQEAAARGRANDQRPNSSSEHWHRAQAAAYEAAHAYAVARPDRPEPPAGPHVVEVTGEDVEWLAREAVRLNNRTLARIAAALLVGRT